MYFIGDRQLLNLGFVCLPGRRAHWKPVEDPTDLNLKAAIFLLELIDAFVILVSGGGGPALAANVAVTAWSDAIVTTQEPVPEHPPPDQPANV